jgi:hypothetical protein
LTAIHDLLYLIVARTGSSWVPMFRTSHHKRLGSSCCTAAQAPYPNEDIKTRHLVHRSNDTMRRADRQFAVNATLRRITPSKRDISRCQGWTGRGFAGYI